ncbi:unnamed protein product [Dicrocoelium dendriticum]|nr:unnamed protein product [Dicrocoelium dendriticum]
MDILKIVPDEFTQPEEHKPIAHVILPTEGFCVKLKTTKQEKVFVNVCHSEKVPAPREISEAELQSILEDIEGSPPFKIPMSIGEAHVETDAAGKACTAYDVIIHPNFLKQVRSSELFEAFLMTVIFEGLESKYGVTLERNWIILKNKKALGRLQEQHVRAESRPAIVELDTPVPGFKPTLIQEMPVQRDINLSVQGEVPQYTLTAVPDAKNPEYLVFQTKLPKLRSSRGVMLDVASDLLQLTTRSQVYTLQTVLDPPVDEEATAAEFNRDNQVLTVTMPVRPVPIK